jgi:hypothetical protein
MTASYNAQLGQLLFSQRTIPDSPVLGEVSFTLLTAVGVLKPATKSIPNELS